MAKEYKWAGMLRDLNKLHKIKSTYIDRILNLQEEGTFYPSFSQHKTISGRYGSDIQQLPRPKEDGELSPLVLKYNNFIRQCFVAGENYVFIDSDYESLEPHVFAHVSGDKGLKDIFRSGSDLYSTVAIATEKLTGVSANKSEPNYLGKINKVLRQRAKAYALGIPYGMNAFALSKSLDIDIMDARTLIDNYLDAYPKLAEWIRDTIYHVIENGQIDSEAGRIRHMPMVPIWHKEGISTNRKFLKKYAYKSEIWTDMAKKSDKMKNYLNNSRNFQIQSLAASITNRACIAIAKELEKENVDGHVCAQIHDQIIVKVPTELAEIWKNKVQYLMTRMVAGDSNNLCVVGDPNQSIYSWRHADITNILDFENDNEKVKTVNLGRNYRSTGSIVSAAQSVIAPNANKSDLQLWTDNPQGNQIGVSYKQMKIYGGYKYISGRWKPVAEALIQNYNLTNNSSVLDIGCGCGSTTISIANEILNNGCLLYTSPSPRDRG